MSGGVLAAVASAVEHVAHAPGEMRFQPADDGAVPFVGGIGGRTRHRHQPVEDGACLAAAREKGVDLVVCMHDVRLLSSSSRYAQTIRVT
ncbi:hypothetical protein [Ollibium composti]|uniref:hypothetical protein n=1 Tax=Ollibium composti TaxID=2675109 RepID=UPI001980216A|nr:hypothetical protein [Mesorhizobium composti]